MWPGAVIVLGCVMSLGLKLRAYFVLDFDIGDGCPQFAAPVHEAVGSVDEASVEEAHECFCHRAVDLLGGMYMFSFGSIVKANLSQSRLLLTLFNYTIICCPCLGFIK